MKRYHYTRFEARLAYHRVWWPKMAYPLPANNFSNAQCQKLQSTCDKTFLPRLGINRQTPKAIIHGPATLGGLSFKHVYTEQGALHASLLLYHLRQPTTEQCNQMSQIMLSHLAIESGLSASPLSIDVPMHHLRNYLLPSFLKTTWLYLHDIGAEIKSSSINVIESQRTHDIFLMDEFTSLEISGKDIRRLQRCRLFLKATRLSDITTFDGIRIHQSCLDGKPPCDRKQLKTYPKQKRPPKRDFLLFWDTLKSLSIINADGTLVTPLGMWAHRDFTTTFYHSFTKQKLYKIVNNKSTTCEILTYNQTSLRSNGYPHIRFFNNTPRPGKSSLPIYSTPITIASFGHLLRGCPHLHLPNAPPSTQTTPQTSTDP